MLCDLGNTKDKVEFLLNKYPELRDCDKKLWLAYLNLFHNFKKKINCPAIYEIIREIFLHGDTPSFESIRRTRQKIQEAGFYVGEKRKLRLKESKSVRRWARRH